MHFFREHLTWKSSILCIAAFAIMAAAYIFAERLSVENAVERQHIRLKADAGLYAATIESELEKFRLVPIVLSSDNDIVASLSPPFGKSYDPSLRKINIRLENLANEMRAAVIYIMDEKGQTIASSNWQLPTSFVGSNYSFREYFKDSMANGHAEQFALGTVSRHPGLYIAQNIRHQGATLGVVVVKVEFDALEKQWAGTAEPVFVADNGVILITSNPDWRFRHHPRQKGEPAIISSQANGTASPLDTQISLKNGWKLHILGDIQKPVEAALLNMRLMLLTAFLLILVLAAFLWFRQRAAAARAEQEINQRLQSLTDQLVQANKLATLGQIAAGVGHEINQPVTAIQSYAENGAKLLAKNDQQMAQENFQHIARLTTRIGGITAELRQFARKATGDMVMISLELAIQGALLLLRERIKSQNAQIIRKGENGDISLMAEHVKVEQVLVNLLQNALDAAGNGAQITIAIRNEGEFTQLSISDNGPGLDPDIAANLFQPFTTSKREGLGLGLVISRDIMQDLGGDLTLGDLTLKDMAGGNMTQGQGQAQKGAEFIITLKNAEHQKGHNARKRGGG